MGLTEWCSLLSYQLMLQCWQEHPSDRPSFVQLRAQFDLMLSKQKNAEELYIVIQADDTSAEMEDLHEKIAKLEPEQKPTVAEPEVSEEERHENPYVENPIRHDHRLSHPDLTVSSLADTNHVIENHCYSRSFNEGLSSSTAGAFQTE